MFVLISDSLMSVSALCSSRRKRSPQSGGEGFTDRELAKKREADFSVTRVRQRYSQGSSLPYPFHPPRPCFQVFFPSTSPWSSSFSRSWVLLSTRDRRSARVPFSLCLLSEFILLYASASSLFSFLVCSLFFFSVQMLAIRDDVRNSGKHTHLRN